VPNDDPPRYHDRRDVPRDLRPASELADRGYHRLGPVRALLVQDAGEVALYSTSEARVRRDALWARPAATGAGTERRSGRHLSRLLEQDFVVLDTETTGLGRNDEIIEIGVVAADGSTVLHSLVFPRAGQVPSRATRVHGLTLDDLEGAPTWPEVLPELRDRIGDRTVLAWNAPFDERMAQQSSRLWRVQHGLPAFECAMRAYALAAGIGSGRRKLAAAAVDQGLLDGPQRHRSTDDARLTLEVLRRMLGRSA